MNFIIRTNTLQCFGPVDIACWWKLDLTLNLHHTVAWRTIILLPPYLLSGLHLVGGSALWHA